VKSIKIFTYIDRDDSIFLELWIKYYNKINNGNLTILYRNTINPELFIKYNYIEFIDINNYISNRIKNQYIIPPQIFTEYQQKFLLDYDVVIYSDLDEFIVHNDINKIVHSDFDTCLVTKGVELVQNLKTEFPFDFNKSINSQRNYMIYSKWYDKPLIINNKINWEGGKHNHGGYSNFIEGLYLIHLGKFCITQAKRWVENNKKIYPECPIDWGNYFRINPELYSKDLNDESHHEHPMILIPTEIKQLINNIL